MQVTKNFNSVSDNMACPCCNAFVYRKPFLDRVQYLRDIMAIPFNLDKRGGGFFRCRDYQQTHHPETKNSQHTLGNAMDIITLGWDGHVKWKFISEATKLGFSIGIYDSFFHIDYRDGKPVMWS